MTKIDLQQIGFTDSTSTLINANSSEIETKSDTFLSRDGRTPNEMLADLDMNSNQILNLPAPSTPNEPLRFQDLLDFTGIGVTSISSLTQTTTPFNTDALRTDISSVGGYFSNYDCKGAFKFVLTQSENQTSGSESGGMRDCFFLNHIDRDTNNYVPSARRVISNGIRSIISGFNNGSAWTQQTKDLHAGWFTAEGRVTGTFGGGTRGVSGILAEAIQDGAGVATNEFGAFNDTAADEQAAQLAPVLAILSGKKAAVDSTHTAIGVTVNNVGKLATAGIQFNSIGTGGDNGQFNNMIDGTSCTVANAAIVMPQSASGVLGTLIVYDPLDYSFYDRAGNAFTWAINNVNRLSVDAGNLFPSANDGLALGTSALKWADLFLASGAVINFNAGDVTLTHSADLLTVAGGTVSMNSGSIAAAGELGGFRVLGSTAAMRLIFGVDNSGTMLSYIQSIEGGVSGRALQLNPLGAQVTIGAGGLDNSGTYSKGGTQVVSSRVTGYTAFTGTNTNRGTAYDTATITLIQLAERVRALQVDLTAHGLIGA